MTRFLAHGVQRRELAGHDPRPSPEPSVPAGAGRFQTLDAWRGICALLVALYHLRFYGYFYEVSAIRHAYLLVDFFFVLSGFVISHAYSHRLDNINNVMVFIIRRFGRLWPLHMFVLLALIVTQALLWTVAEFTNISLGLFPFMGDYAPHILPSHIVLIHSLGLYETNTWNDPSWSISVEFYVCILFAFVCFMLLFKRAMIFVILASFSFMIIAVYPGDIDVSADLGFFRGAYGFSIGYIVYRIWAGGRSGLRRPGLWELGAVVATFTFNSLCGNTPASLAAPLVFGMAVWVFAHEAGTLSSLLKLRPLIFLGAISYSVYMVHAFIGNMMYYGILVAEKFIDFNLEMESELVHHDSRYVMDGLMIVYVLAVVMTAVLTYRYVEHPGRRYFNSLARSIAGRRHLASQSPSRRSTR